MLKQAAAEFDEAKRNKLLADATRVAMEDAGILPLYWQKPYWAARKGSWSIRTAASPRGAVVTAK